MSIPYLFLFFSFILCIYLIEAKETTLRDNDITNNHHYLKITTTNKKPVHHSKITPFPSKPTPSYTIIPGHNLTKFWCYNVTGSITFVQCEVTTTYIPPSSSYIKPTKSTISSTSTKSSNPKKKSSSTSKSTSTTKKSKHGHRPITTTTAITSHHSKSKKTTRTSSSQRHKNTNTSHHRSYSSTKKSHPTGKHTNKNSGKSKSILPKDETETPYSSITTTTASSTTTTTTITTTTETTTSETEATTSSDINYSLNDSPLGSSETSHSSPTSTPSTDILSPDVNGNVNNRNLGIGLGVSIGCIAAIALAGLLIYNHRKKNDPPNPRSLNVLGDDDHVNTRWRTQSFMGVVAAVVAKLPRSASLHSKSSMNSRNNNNNNHNSMNSTGIAYTTSLQHHPSTGSIGSPPPLTSVNDHMNYQHRY